MQYRRNGRLLETGEQSRSLIHITCSLNCCRFHDMVTQRMRNSLHIKNPMFHVMEGMHNVEAMGSVLVHIELPYVPLRWEGAPKVQVPKKKKYNIKLPKIPMNVSVDGNMLGLIPELRYLEHDFSDYEKLPNFTSQYYMKLVPTK